MPTIREACRRKRTFNRPKQAQRLIRDARLRGIRLYLYHCPTCGKWHLTKNTRTDPYA